MTYRFVDVNGLEPENGVFRKVREALEIGSFGVNEMTLAPFADGYPEHDELKTGQDELYVILEGSASMTIDGEAIELVPGRYVFVTPDSKRHIAPGADGVRLVAIGVSADHRHDGRY